MEAKMNSSDQIFINTPFGEIGPDSDGFPVDGLRLEPDFRQQNQRKKCKSWVSVFTRWGFPASVAAIGITVSHTDL
jgi:hypothetical protein